MRKNIVCQKCKSVNNSVYSVRKYEDRIIRYRECKDCQNRFVTIEVYRDTNIQHKYEKLTRELKKIVDDL